MPTCVFRFLPLAASLVLSLAPTTHAGQETPLPEAQFGPEALTPQARAEQIITDSGAGRLRLITAEGVAFHATGREVNNLLTVPVQGSTTRIHTWLEERPDGSQASMYAFQSDDSRIRGRVRETTHRVRLAAQDFDPSIDMQVIAPTLAARSSNRLFLVQMVAPPLPEMRSAIEERGGTIHRFLTDHTFLVEADSDSLAAINGLAFVRWSGPYHAEYRMEEVLRVAVATGSEPLPRQRYSIMTCARGAESQNAIATRVVALGGEVHLTTPEGRRMEASLTQEQLVEITHMNAVQFIDRWGGPGETDMDIVRQVGGADYVEAVAGYTGNGVRGEIFDTELLTSHQEWGPAPIIHSPGTSSSNLHGSNCYSISFATGIDAEARGLVPDGQGIFFRHSDSTQFGGSISRYTINQDLIDPSGPYRAVYQTSSVGSSRTTSYTTVSAEVDDYLFLHPVLSTQSQSNAGSQNSRPQAWAKNIVSVGAVYHQGTATRSDDSWSSGASIGPAADGRIKPDLAYWYDGIHSARGSGNTSYSEFGGTSAATPTTAGHFGLLFEMWHDGIWSGHGGAATVFDSRPEMATAKALMINAAYRYDWNSGGSNADIDRFKQGWGTADVQRLYDRASETTIIDETDLITPLEVKQYQVTVAPGQDGLNVTLVFTDPAGTVGASQARINDLSLKVITPSGIIYYWGNNGLDADNQSMLNGASNTLDTVENVFVQNPIAGVWTVEVHGDEIVEDAHLETSALDADYALVINGGDIGSVLPPTIINVAPSSIRAVNVGTAQTIVISGTNFSASSTVSVDSQPLFGIPSPYTVVSSNAILFSMPLVSKLGLVPITVTNAAGSATTLINVTANQIPAVEINTGDQPVPLFSFFGGATVTMGSSPNSTVILTASLDRIPSTVPGLLNLGIGNNFSSLFVLGFHPVPLKGWTQTTIPFSGLAAPTNIYWQTIALPGVPGPFPTSNVQASYVVF